MTCTPAPSCTAALHQATLLWPHRNTAGDGICASAAHHLQNPNSDHEVGNAYDLTHDPANGVDTYALAIALAKRNDSRVKYIISNRRIWEPGFLRGLFNGGWRDYHGADPHTGHMHVSINSNSRTDTRPWFVSTQPTTPEEAMATGQFVEAKLPQNASGSKAILFPSDPKLNGRVSFFAVKANGDVYNYNQKDGFGFKALSQYLGHPYDGEIVGFECGYGIDPADGNKFSIMFLAADGGTFLYGAG